MLWAELNCQRKTCSNRSTLLVGWSNHYNLFMVVITIWLTVTKYPFLNWQWIASFLHRLFCPQSPTIFLMDMTIYMTNTGAYRADMGVSGWYPGWNGKDHALFSMLYMWQNLRKREKTHSYLIHGYFATISQFLKILV